MAAILACVLSLACSGGGGGTPALANAIGFDEAAAIQRSSFVLPTQLVATDAASFASAVAQANALGCGVEIAVSGSITANAALTATCPTRDELGIRVLGPATIHGEISATCTGANCAWVSLEGLTVTNDGGDAFDCAGDARLAIIDSTGAVSGPFNNVLTSHQTCELLALGAAGSSSGLDRAPTIAVINDSKATILGTGEFVASETPYDAVVLLGGTAPGTQLAIIGHVLSCRAGNQYAIDFEPLPLGTAMVESAKLSANCPVDVRLGALESAFWASFFDSLPGYLDTPTQVPAVVVIDNNNVDRLVLLPVAIPAWVEGNTWSYVRVAP